MADPQAATRLSERARAGMALAEGGVELLDETGVNDVFEEQATVTLEYFRARGDRQLAPVLNIVCGRAGAE